MKIENLQINIEVLVPGILQTIVLCHLFPGILDFLPKRDALPGGEFGAELITSMTFLAAAYAAGVFCTVFARFLMDGPADRSFTPLLLWFFERDDFSNINKPLAQRRDILNQYREARKKEVKAEGPGLSTITKYRRIAQTLRACVVPAMFFAWSLSGSGLCTRITAVSVTYFCGLFVFAYCEVALYQQYKKIEG